MPTGQWWKISRQTFEVLAHQPIAIVKPDLGRWRWNFRTDNLPVGTDPLVRSAEDVKKLKIIAPEDGRRMSDRLDWGTDENERSSGTLARPGFQGR